MRYGPHSLGKQIDWKRFLLRLLNDFDGFRPHSLGNRNPTYHKLKNTPYPPILDSDRHPQSGRITIG